MLQGSAHVHASLPQVTAHGSSPSGPHNLSVWTCLSVDCPPTGMLCCKGPDLVRCSQLDPPSRHTWQVCQQVLVE